tara:strand:- start:611 stop:799 length:189 start_codon:yes stop_codon:yes gene_type:complete
VNYSVIHDAFYDAMIMEMLKYAGFQESVVFRLGAIGDYISEEERANVDDFYQIYAAQQVIDD